MYPELFTIPGIDLTISTFGLMVATAFLVGSWITSIRMGEEGLVPDSTILLYYVIFGGLLGSKLYFAIDVSLRSDASFASLMLSRSGITWYGGLIGATLAGAIGCRRHGVPVKTFADCVAVGGAVGQAIGRVLETSFRVMSQGRAIGAAGLEGDYPGLRSCDVSQEFDFWVHTEYKNRFPRFVVQSRSKCDE